MLIFRNHFNNGAFKCVAIVFISTPQCRTRHFPNWGASATSWTLKFSAGVDYVFHSCLILRYSLFKFLRIEFWMGGFELRMLSAVEFSESRPVLFLGETRWASESETGGCTRYIILGSFLPKIFFFFLCLFSLPLDVNVSFFMHFV